MLKCGYFLARNTAHDVLWKESCGERKGAIDKTARSVGKIPYLCCVKDGKISL